AAHPRPRQARRRTPRPRRRGHLAAGEEGADARRDGAAHPRPSHGRGALRRAPRAPVLRRAGRLHHRRPARRDGRRRAERRRRHTPPHGRHQPDGGHPRLPARRLRAGDRPEPRARLGLRAVGHPRDRHLLPRPL
ncbi:MAG: Nucleoside diphosphate kinase, partial [uncultured Frankineae bacterium]